MTVRKPKVLSALHATRSHPPSSVRRWYVVIGRVTYGPYADWSAAMAFAILQSYNPRSLSRRMGSRR